MSVEVRERPGRAEPINGGVPARRAVIRWAWRLLRREWRQQLLILALITVAVAATFVGSAVATNTPPAADAGFGTASNMATLGPGPHVAAQIAAIAHRFGRAPAWPCCSRCQSQRLRVAACWWPRPSRRRSPRRPR